MLMGYNSKYFSDDSQRNDYLTEMGTVHKDTCLVLNQTIGKTEIHIPSSVRLLALLQVISPNISPFISNIYLIEI